MTSHFLRIFARAAIAVPVLFSCNKTPDEKRSDTITTLTGRFADPPAEYRVIPFWVWNEQISAEGIDFQLKKFKEAGIGGVFVHPRPGLITEYLSEEWHRLFDHAVRKGQQLGMKVWIYDENSYPSGFAGGRVPAEMPDSYRHGAGLALEIQPVLKTVPADTVEVVLRKEGDRFIDLTGEAPRLTGQNGPWYVYRKTYPVKSWWYGGFSYVDLLYPGVTEKFLEITMKGYEERNRADFGNTLAGVFTDEPNLEAALSDGAVMRWTPDLWDAFGKRWGYDLRTSLPSLTDETGNWRKVRHDYYELLLELFLDRWSKPWFGYCRANRLTWTGHYWEHGWPVPTDGIDELAFYTWHQMPGVDMLGFRLDSAGSGGQFGNDRAIRELLSAANQAGWKRTMSETYGGGGWDMPFREQKRLADWQFALGVNCVNLCLSFYSLNGVRKFDYPLSFTYHEPWWKEYRWMADYLGRISMALASGDQINKTIVLQPNTSAWMYFSRRTANARLAEIRDGFKKFVYLLEQQQAEYDLGSENVIRQKRYLEMDSLFEGKPGFEATYRFTLKEDISPEIMNRIRAVAERPGLWEVSINGHIVSPSAGEYWMDRDFAVYPAGPFLHHGDNSLTLKAPRMHILAEIMPVYLLGDFLVKPADRGFEMTGGSFAATGSWSREGMPFYPGKVSYSLTFKPVQEQQMSCLVTMPEWNGPVAEVTVNGQPAGIIAFPPYELDVTPLIRPDENEITVTVCGSLKNTFGPFHDRSDDWIIGPHSWIRAPGHQPPGQSYFLNDYGLTGPFRLFFGKQLK